VFSVTEIATFRPTLKYYFCIVCSRCLWTLGRSDVRNYADWRTSGWHCTWLFATVVTHFWP